MQKRYTQNITELSVYLGKIPKIPHCIYAYSNILNPKHFWSQAFWMGKLDVYLLNIYYIPDQRDT